MAFFYFKAQITQAQHSLERAENPASIFLFISQMSLWLHYRELTEERGFVKVRHLLGKQTRWWWTGVLVCTANLY